MSESTGVVFPLVDGRRSTAATGRTIVADALRQVDPIGAAAAERETNWRAGYLVHFRRLVEAGLPTADAALAIARHGLASVHTRLQWGDPDAADQPLANAFRQPPAPVATEEVVDSFVMPVLVMVSDRVGETFGLRISLDEVRIGKLVTR